MIVDLPAQAHRPLSLWLKSKGLLDPGASEWSAVFEMVCLRWWLGFDSLIFRIGELLWRSGAAYVGEKSRPIGELVCS